MEGERRRIDKVHQVMPIFVRDLCCKSDMAGVLICGSWLEAVLDSRHNEMAVKSVHAISQVTSGSSSQCSHPCRDHPTMVARQETFAVLTSFRGESHFAMALLRRYYQKHICTPSPWLIKLSIKHSLDESSIRDSTSISQSRISLI